MTKTLSRLLRALSWPERIVGPIFLKELRVSSRRGRNYLLRLLYVVAMAGVVAAIWWSMLQWSGEVSPRYVRDRMAEAGKTIILSIVWFQFVAAQLLAVLLLGGAINTEITQHTLGVLMTTPLGGLQIVMGKLFSKLWQILILLGLSVPLMMLVRVLGGVPVGFVAAGVCMTLTTTILLASVSLYLSIYNRRVHVVVIKTLALAAAAFGLIPALLVMVVGEDLAQPAWTALLYHSNPYVAMVMETQEMTSPGRSATPGLGSWPAHCLLMLAAAAGFLAAAAGSARRAALAQAAGGNLASPPRPEALDIPLPAGPAHRPAQDPDAAAPEAPPEGPPSGPVRRVVGPPIVWKEMRGSVFGTRRLLAWSLAVMVAALGFVYAVCAAYRLFTYPALHGTLIGVFLAVGALSTAVMSAAAMTSEKESRCWPLLLGTTMSDGGVVVGKAAGVWGRALPAWIMLAGHVLVFVALGFIHPLAIVHVAALAAYLGVFLTGLGLYFSSRFRRTTAAVAATLGVVAAIWLILPLLLPLVMAVSPAHEDLGRVSLAANPAVQATVVVEAAVGRGRAGTPTGRLYYDWPWLRAPDSAAATTWFMLINAGAYGLAGLLLGWRAKHHLRRDVFGAE